MKTRILMAFIALSTLSIKGQMEQGEVQTLFGNKSGFGGYMGVNAKTTEISGQEALFIGGELAFVLNRSFNLGVEGYGMVNELRSDRLSDFGERLYLQMGYGGIHFEPVLFSESVIHLTVPILLGAGGVGETAQPYWSEEDGVIEIDTSPIYRKSDFFLVAEPGLMLELNFFKFMRFGAGASYRFTSDIDLGNMTGKDIQGFNGNLSLRFGWF